MKCHSIDRSTSKRYHVVCSLCKYFALNTISGTKTQDFNPLEVRRAFTPLLAWEPPPPLGFQIRPPTFYVYKYICIVWKLVKTIGPHDNLAVGIQEILTSLGNKRTVVVAVYKVAREPLSEDLRCKFQNCISLVQT